MKLFTITNGKETVDFIYNLDRDLIEVTNTVSFIKIIKEGMNCDMRQAKIAKDDIIYMLNQITPSSDALKDDINRELSFITDKRELIDILKFIRSKADSKNIEEARSADDILNLQKIRSKKDITIGKVKDQKVTKLDPKKEPF